MVTDPLGWVEPFLEAGADSIIFCFDSAQDPGAVFRAVKASGEKAVAWCRAGKGPYILEMETYRYRGHSMSDPAKYRTREEVNDVREHHDPIDRARARIVEKKFATEDDLKAVETAVRDRIIEAAEFAQAGPEPDPSALWTDITH